MNDKLKPNQEKRIIENCVESIMDDLDVYHFDEKLFQQYEKQLTEFFTKISEEHSLFSPRFDLSNKKNIVNDKEKIKEVLGILEKKIKHYEGAQEEFFAAKAYAEAARFKHMKELLEEIEKILEA